MARPYNAVPSRDHDPEKDDWLSCGLSKNVHSVIMAALALIGTVLIFIVLPWIVTAQQEAAGTPIEDQPPPS